MTQGHAQHLCSGCISSTTMASCAVFGRRASVVSERVISKLCQEVHSRPQRQPSVLRLVGQCSEAPQHMAQRHRHLRPSQPLAARQLLAAAPFGASSAAFGSTAPTFGSTTSSPFGASSPFGTNTGVVQEMTS